MGLVTILDISTTSLTQVAQAIFFQSLHERWLCVEELTLLFFDAIYDFVFQRFAFEEGSDV